MEKTHDSEPVKDTPKDHLEKHLDNELQWMLRAATEWFIQEQLDLRIDGYSVQVYALDSACLHARSLFEFFLKRKNKKPKNKEFLDKPFESDLYRNWREPLQRFLFHVSDRSKTKKLTLSDGSKKDLNKMPVDFANEVLRLWREFEKKLLASSKQEDKELGELAQKKREDAIAGAKRVLDSEVARCHAKGKVLKPPSFLSDLTEH